MAMALVDSAGPTWEVSFAIAGDSCLRFVVESCYRSYLRFSLSLGSHLLTTATGRQCGMDLS
jgi:hypothetical protein